MPKQKWRNRTLERGVVIDRSRGYIYVRTKHLGVTRKEWIGRASDSDVIDRANYRARQIRDARRVTGSGFELRRERMLMEDVADLLMKLHGEKRESQKGAKQFRRYARLIKESWQGRYVDSMTDDDIRRYRERRRQDGVSESTVNREHTAISTLFNKLPEWRRSGLIPSNVLLPEFNPARGVKKVNEQRFIRNRLMSDDEYQRLFNCADERIRRIILAEMNLPLRLEDLKQLSKRMIDYKLRKFRGVQAKTKREYALPINAVLWRLIKTAPSDHILDFSGFNKRWKQTLTRAKVGGLQFRDLRRTAATALHDGGTPLRTISEMLGHSSVTTTIRYLGLKEENLKEAGDLLAEKYFAPVASGQIHVESVPQSVPTAAKKVDEKESKTDCNINDLGGVAQLVRAAAS